MDLNGFFSWLGVALVFVFGPWFLTRLVAGRYRHLTDRVADWLERHREPEHPAEYGVDDAPELASERLEADLHRLRLILADDTSMSATRQRANRMAYDRLVEDLHALRERSDLAADRPVRLVPAWGQRAEAPLQPVETIEINWRR